MIDTGGEYRGDTSTADTGGDIPDGPSEVDATYGLTTDVVTPPEQTDLSDEFGDDNIFARHTGPSGDESLSDQGDGYRDPFDLSGTETPEPGHSQGGDSEPPESRTGFADNSPDDGNRPSKSGGITIGDVKASNFEVFTDQGNYKLGDGEYTDFDAGGVQVGHIEVGGKGPDEKGDVEDGERDDYDGDVTIDGSGVVIGPGVQIGEVNVNGERVEPDDIHDPRTDDDPEWGSERGHPISYGWDDTDNTVVIGPGAQIGEINIDERGVEVRYIDQPEDETGPFGDDYTEAVPTQGPIGGLDSGAAEAEGTSRDTAADSDGDRSGLLVDGDNTQAEDGDDETVGDRLDAEDGEQEEGADTSSNEGDASDDTETYHPYSETRYVNITYDENGEAVVSPEPVSDSTADAIDAWRYKIRDKVIDDLKPFLSENPLKIDLDRIYHYCRALGVPDRPLIVLEDAHDNATSEALKAWGINSFEENPNLMAWNLPIPRIILIDGKSITSDRAKNSPKRVVVHEMFHTSLPETINVSPDSSAGDISFTFTQSGFVSGYDGPEDEQEGVLIDESVAEIGSSTYAEIFPDNTTPDDEPTVKVNMNHIPYKYSTRYGFYDNTITGCRTATAIEIIAMQRQQQDEATSSAGNQLVLESLFASRTSHGGISDFHDYVNSVASEPGEPGLYDVMHKPPVNEANDIGNIGHVLDRIHPTRTHDEALAVAAARNTKMFIIGKLRKYEAETGYSFNLPDDNI